VPPCCTGDENLRLRDEAVGAFTQHHRDGVLRALFQSLVTASSGNSSQRFSRMLDRLPALSFISPVLLRDGKLWTDAACAAAQHLAHHCAAAPRYFKGRIVYTPGGELSRLVEIGSTTVRVQALARGEEEDEDEDGDGGILSYVEMDTTSFLQINQRHHLPSTSRQDNDPVLHLEDGITCKYGSKIARGKLAEIALVLSPVMEEIGNVLKQEPATSPKVDALRCKCVREVRACLNITTFQRSGDEERSRNRQRYCKDDAARFACYGEGHCHTVTSTMAAFLAPWCETLGMDICYREDSGGHHQWLEFTLRPSMRSFICDLYREDGPSGGHGYLLAVPVTTAYEAELVGEGNAASSSSAAASFYPPAPTPIVMSGHAIRLAALEEGDVDSDVMGKGFHTP